MTCINVDYVSFKDKTAELTDLLIRLGNEMERIAEITQNMDIFWDGDANAAYVQKISEDLVKMGIIVMHIKETAGITRRALAVYMRSEAEVSRIIRDINETVRKIGR